MMYLEFILLIIIISLVYILISKLKNIKEGFEHKGDGSVANKAAAADSVNKLMNSNLQQENKWLDAADQVFTVTSGFASNVIKTPYKLWYYCATGLMNFMIDNFSAILNPMVSFAKQMFRAAIKFIKSIFSLLKSILKNGFSIMRNLPEAGLKIMINMEKSIMNAMNVL